MISTALCMLPSLQPATESQLAGQNVVPIVALGGVAEDALDYVWNGRGRKRRAFNLNGVPLN